MSLKKIVITSLILMALFFFVGWVFTPAIMEFIIGHMKSVSKNLEIISPSIKAQFRIHIFSSLSIASVPLLGMLVSIFLIKVRKKYLTSWDYLFYLSILAVVYFVASVFKYYALEGTVIKVLNNPLSPNIKNTLPLDQVLLYDWAFYGSLAAGILIVLLAKRKSKA
jgi:hypothetical protein